MCLLLQVYVTNFKCVDNSDMHLLIADSHLFLSLCSSGQCVGVGSNFNDDVSSFGPDPGLVCTIYRSVTRFPCAQLATCSPLFFTATRDALVVPLAASSTLVRGWPSPAAPSVLPLSFPTHRHRQPGRLQQQRRDELLQLHVSTCGRV